MEENIYNIKALLTGKVGLKIKLGDCIEKGDVIAFIQNGENAKKKILKSNVSGKVKNIFFENGEFVTSDEIIMEIELSDEKIQEKQNKCIIEKYQKLITLRKKRKNCMQIALLCNIISFILLTFVFKEKSLLYMPICILYCITALIFIISIILYVYNVCVNGKTKTIINKISILEENILYEKTKV